MPREKRGQTYRHTPAFILVLLAREKLYGAALLARLESDLPDYKADSAAIYRALQELESEGSIAAEWETDVSGPARKWYAITRAGTDRLREFKLDIERRKKNLEFFLERYAELRLDKKKERK